MGSNSGMIKVDNKYYNLLTGDEISKPYDETYVPDASQPEYVQITDVYCPENVPINMAYVDISGIYQNKPYSSRATLGCIGGWLIDPIIHPSTIRYFNVKSY